MLLQHYSGFVAKSCPTLANLCTVALQAPLSIAFSRQEYWSGLPFPSQGDLSDPGIKPRSPALQADSLPTYLSKYVQDLYAENIKHLSKNKTQINKSISHEPTL